MTEFQRAIFGLILLVGLPVIAGLFAVFAGGNVGEVTGAFIGTIALVGLGMGIAWFGKNVM